MADVIGNGEERIQQLEQQLEMEKQKYRIISGMVKCGLWEYTVSTGILVQCRLGEGMGEKDRLRIQNFRESLLNAGLVYEEDLPVFDLNARCHADQFIGPRQDRFNDPAAIG